jgi:hypothetical protein
VPAFRVAAQQLSKKREALLQRRVLAWDEKFKDRTDKRELRMLHY